ncbi:DNA-binding protein [Marinitoga sp. 1197]|uniref:Gldg family protein n=1 Tax=Marinitoga sp. 1197 TaxID=1428449 RepID=UPI00064128BF|nr:DNA-binding protein [Marinitoga sp. 1197]KLO21647.1 DNA-binding protein [Marinitoga sp. 1197]
MKKIITLIIIILTTLSFATISEISKVRELKDLQTVTVRGIVTVEPGPFDVNIIFLQDKTGGINLYFRGGQFENVERGDLVEAKGYLWTHKNNKELVLEKDNSSHYYKIISKNNPLPEPIKIKTVDINNENYEGMFLKVKGKIVEIDKFDMRKIYIDDGSGKGMVFIRENTGINPSFFKVGINMEAVGVLGQYMSYYELWPRNMNDIYVDDVFPPEVKTYAIRDNYIYVEFNEPIFENSIILNKTVRVLKSNILEYELSMDNKILKLKLNSLNNASKLVLRSISDKNNNKMGMKIIKLNLEKDSYANRVLFDNNHGQTAGNADWVINGGYSDFADAAKNLGLKVEEIKEDFNEDILNMYKILIIPEPNKPFKDFEVSAILKFVKNGGSLFIISDHGNSDRNGNGWDSPKIFNTFVEKFGFKFAGDDLEEAPLAYVYNHEITKGIKKIGVWNGSSIEVLNDKVKVLIANSENKPYMVVTTYGKGKVVAIGDSSPFDDGTGDTGDLLHNGWQWGDDAQLAINTIKYLIK